jgi:hypothetical protein
MDVYLSKSAVIRNDPGAVLSKPYKTITVVTSSETFVFLGEGSTARSKLDSLRRSTAPPKDKRCLASIKADGGSKATIVFAARS